CASTSSCIALAGRRGSHVRVQRWDGAQWTYVDVALPDGIAYPDIVLKDVSCTSPIACTLVGYDGHTAQGLIEDWDGSHWAVSPSANDPMGVTQLDAVSCTAATTCTAVGFSTRIGTILIAE